MQVAVQQYIQENPAYRLSPRMGLAYPFLHYLIGDLYTAMALYLHAHVRRSQLRACLIRSAKKLNSKMRLMLSLPGVFPIVRMMVSKVMTLANGKGFEVIPVDCGRRGFGFDVLACPFHALFAKYHVMELGPMFCYFDEIEGANLPGLQFVRNGTLCKGCQKCDFRYLRT